MSNSKGKRIGFVGTIIFHIGLLAILFYLGFHTPLPLPEEEGILVNFGNTNQGLGKKDPAPSQSTQAVTAVSKPAPKPQVSQSKPEKSTSSANEKILTQETEEAPSVPSAKETAKKKAEIEKNKKIKAEQDRLKKIEKEKKRQEEIKQQQEAEAERQRLAEIEKLRKEEAERQEKIANINNKAKNVFGQGTASNSSQGNTSTSGNQGAPNGSSDSDNYNGSGLGNKGVSYDLKGRNSMSIPKPQYNLQESGKVVVEITVDRNGKVVNARPGMPGSTTSNSTLFEAARKAAMKAVFNSDPKASAFQQGSITYHFQLD
ncbi:cell envelope integrity protein TolA [Labilibaculum sp.]|uniref:cell envelope integrity protein TolA n=1 Tax=Labilibaculum sp. TaxID=2060723 RepID=UPI002AA6F4F5|nr:cell envelope integrity protein TolA [Labilibaculum sp.]MBN2595829.1 TonB family protein [Marinifilaceae bacterium]